MEDTKSFRFPFILLVVLCTWPLTFGNVVTANVNNPTDANPYVQLMVTMVNMLTQRVDQLTEQIAAQEVQISEIRTLSGTSARTTGFSVQFNTWNIQNLSQGQTLLFNNVLYNEGNGYNPATGRFTAPSAGTYLFYVNLARHFASRGALEVKIMHGETHVATANAYTNYLNSGSNMVVLYLNEGDAVDVRMHKGSSMHGGSHTSFTGIKLS